MLPGSVDAARATRFSPPEMQLLGLTEMTQGADSDTFSLALEVHDATPPTRHQTVSGFVSVSLLARCEGNLVGNVASTV